jgi:hypothetical protein
MNHTPLLSLLALLLWHGTAPAATGTAIIHSAPAGAPLSSAYKVTVDDQPVPVYDARIDEPRNNAFASFDMTGSVKVQVTVPEGFQSITIRPASAGIRADVKDRMISFELAKPCQLSIELNGSTHYPLFLFANPPEVNPPGPQDAGVRYFGPGIHTPGRIKLADNETLYVAGGAIVRGYVTVDNATNVMIRGRGILDAHDNTSTMVCVRNSKNVVFEGLTIADQPAKQWTVSYWSSEDLRIEDVKIMAGDPPFSNDGIDLCSCERAVIQDCFVKAHDDTICIKAMTHWGRKDQSPPPIRRGSKDILVQGCLLWPSYANGIVIGAELNAPEVSDMVFRNCDIIHPAEYGTGTMDYYGALGIFNCDDAVVSRIRFEDIRIEDMLRAAPRAFNFQICERTWGRTPTRGFIRDITLKNIRILDQIPVCDIFHGFDGDHRVENVTIEDLRIGGKLIATADSLAGIDRETTRNIRVTTSSADPSELAPAVRSSIEITHAFAPTTTTSRGKVRLTFKNESLQGVAHGQVRLAIVPQSSRETIADADCQIQGGQRIGLSLEPGQQTTREVEIEMPQGKYMLWVIPEAPGVALAKMPLVIDGVMARVEPVANVAKIKEILANQTVHHIRSSGQVLGTVKYAISGTNLAIQATVLDARITPEPGNWPVSTLEIMASVPGSPVVRQVAFVPQFSAGKVTLHENGKEQAIPVVEWQSQALHGNGCEVTALIPLSVFNLDSKVDQLLLEVAICASPQANSTPQYATLFKSVGAFRNNNCFALMQVE